MEDSRKSILLALTTTGAIFLIRLGLNRYLNDGAPFLLFTLAVAVSAIWGGFRSGLLATVFSAVLATCFFLAPQFSLKVTQPSNILHMMLFLVVGVALCYQARLQRRTQHTVEEHEEFLERIIETTVSGIIVTDASGNITFANSAAANLFGLTTAHMIGRRADETGWGGSTPSGEPIPTDQLPSSQVLRGGSGLQGYRMAVRSPSDTLIQLAINAAPPSRQTRRHRGRRSFADAPPRNRRLIFMESPLTIVYLDHTAKLSGGEIALLRLLESMDRTRIRAIVVLAEDGPLRERLEKIGVECRVVPLSGNIKDVRKDTLDLGILRKIGLVFGLFGYSLRLSQLLRKLGAQVVHTNSLKSDFYGGVASSLAGIPFVWHVRDHIDPSYLPMPAVKVFRYLAQRWPSYVVTNSQSTLDRLFLTRRQPSAVIPSGIDLRRGVIHDGLAAREFDEVVEVIDRKPWSSPVRVGIVGRLASWKGQHIFIEAARQVLAEGADAEFLIAGSAMFGEDDYVAQLEKQVADAKLEDRVKFLGFVKDVPGLLDLASTFSFTPRRRRSRSVRSLSREWPRACP